MNIDKLYELGKIWGEIKYFNPYIHINNIDWNKAFTDCYSIIKDCENTKFIEIINKHLLSKLNDPLARAESLRSNKTNCNFENSFKISSESIVILKLNDWSNDNVDNLIKKAIENRHIAKGFILDIRNLTEETEKQIFSKLDKHKLLRYFCATTLKRTSDLVMEYEGFPNERSPENITFYKSYFKIQNKPSISILTKSVEVPIIIIAEKSNPLSTNILDLRNNNKCKIISVNDTLTHIPDSFIASIKTKFGEIAYSVKIPIFNNSTKPIYSDFLINETNEKEIIEFAVKQINNFSDFVQQTEIIDITNDIKMDLNFNENSFPNEIERVMAVTKIYSVIKYFFPFKELMDCNWDEIYKIFLSKAIKSSCRIDYINLIKEMGTFIEDSHVYLWYTRKKAIRKIPVTAFYLENKMIISEITNEEFQTLHNIEIGDEIIEINEKSVDDLIEKQGNYISASRGITKLRDLMRELLIGEINKSFSLKLLSKKGIEKTIYSKYGEFVNSDNFKKKSTKSIIESTESILYVNLYTLSDNDTSELDTKLTEFKNVIFDLRGYPSHPKLFSLLKQLCHKEIFDWGKSKIPIISYKSTNEDENYFAYKTLINKYKSHSKFKNKIVVLVNEETQSYAEAISDALRVNSDAVLIGSNTAGANGDITFMSLPGNLDLMFSQMVVLISDGSSMQKVGLYPDIKVDPTIDGIRSGRDELIEKAIEYFNDKS